MIALMYFKSEAQELGSGNGISWARSKLSALLERHLTFSEFSSYLSIKFDILMF